MKFAVAFMDIRFKLMTNDDSCNNLVKGYKPHALGVENRQQHSLLRCFDHLYMDFFLDTGHYYKIERLFSLITRKFYSAFADNF